MSRDSDSSRGGGDRRAYSPKTAYADPKFSGISKFSRNTHSPINFSSNKKKWNVNFFKIIKFETVNFCSHLLKILVALAKRENLIGFMS